MPPLFKGAANDDFWDIKIDISGAAASAHGFESSVDYMLSIFSLLQATILAERNKAGADYAWEQITIEGLWIFDHGDGYGNKNLTRDTPEFKSFYRAMGDALDNNHGRAATIHHRGCDLATDYGDGSDIKSAAKASGHAVTGGVGFTWWYPYDQPGADYYSDGGYYIATPNETRTDATVTSWSGITYRMVIDHWAGMTPIYKKVEVLSHFDPY